MAFGDSKYDEFLAARVAAGAMLADAARDAGCSARTASRRARESGFQARVAEIRAGMVRGVTEKVVGHLTCVVDELRRLLTGAESETVRLGAARTLLEYALRLREHSDFETRLQALERDAGTGLPGDAEGDDDAGDGQGAEATP
jgi:hypothetical protein